MAIRAAAERGVKLAGRYEAGAAGRLRVEVDVDAAQLAQAAAERSIRAGADIVLLSSSGSYVPVYNRLLARAHSDRAFRVRVKEAYARVRALKDSLTK